MGKITMLIKDVVKFITEDIWQKHESEYNSRFMLTLARQLKVFIFTVRNYGKDQIDIRSAALTYYTLASLVPLAALIFGIAKGLMFDTSVSAFLYEKFPNHTEVVDVILKFADALLARTKGGVLASIGFVVLLWAVVNVFTSIENAFNHIWKVRKSRSITRKVSDYLSVMLVAPIFWLVSSSASNVVGVVIDNAVDGTFLEPAVNFLTLLLPFILVWIMLTVIYFVMPNTKVKFSAALRSAVITGTVFHLFQILYVYAQSSFFSYNAIYGSFAALPLLLLWLSISWQIIMFGAELSFGYQNIEKYEYEQESYNINYEYRKRAIILIMHRIATNFREGLEPLDSAGLSHVLHLPVKVVRDVLYDLEQAKLIVSVDDQVKKTDKYLPARDVSRMKILDIIKQVECTGDFICDVDINTEFDEVNNIFRELDREAGVSSKNMVLMDIGRKDA